MGFWPVLLLRSIGALLGWVVGSIVAFSMATGVVDQN